MKRLRWFLLLLATGSCAGPAKQPTTATVPAAEAAFQQAASELYQVYFDHIPAAFAGNLGVSLGMHQYDGRLPDDSPAALKEREAFLADARARLETFPAGALTESSRLERDVFVTRLRGGLFDLTVRRTPWRSPLYYIGPLSLL